MAAAKDIQNLLGSIGDAHGFKTSSTTRTPEYNRKVGGVANSQHLDQIGTARDWSVKGKTKEEIAAFKAALQAKGFEVLVHNVKTGLHVHAELPPGGLARSGKGGSLDLSGIKAPAYGKVDLPEYEEPTPELLKMPAAAAAEDPAAALQKIFAANAKQVDAAKAAAMASDDTLMQQPEWATQLTKRAINDDANLIRRNAVSKFFGGNETPQIEIPEALDAAISRYLAMG